VITVARGSFQIPAGINDAGCGWHTDLEQTKFLPIGVKAVCLSVDCDTIGDIDLLEQLRQLVIGRNETRLQ
jgi:hypothetical protein